MKAECKGHCLLSPWIQPWLKRVSPGPPEMQAPKTRESPLLPKAGLNLVAVTGNRKRFDVKTLCVLRSLSVPWESSRENDLCGG